MNPLVRYSTSPLELKLPSGRVLPLPACFHCFDRWQGAPIDTYGHKAVIDSSGEPLFAELAILRLLQAGGWQGVWVDTYRRRFRRSLPPQFCELPAHAEGFLNKVSGGPQLASRLSRRFRLERGPVSFCRGQTQGQEQDWQDPTGMVRIRATFSTAARLLLGLRVGHFGRQIQSQFIDSKFNCTATNPDMTVDDFRRIALSPEGAEEGSHMGQPDFRIGGRIFVTLASGSQGFGNVKLTPEQQAALVEEMPEVFAPIPGGWGRMGMTHVRLAAATEDVTAGALRAAWKLRVERNAKSAKGARRTKTMGVAEVVRKRRRNKKVKDCPLPGMQEPGVARRPWNGIVLVVNARQRWREGPFKYSMTGPGLQTLKQKGEHQ